MVPANKGGRVIHKQNLFNLLKCWKSVSMKFFASCGRVVSRTEVTVDACVWALKKRWCTEVIGHHVLMPVSKSFQNILEILCVIYHSFERAVLSLKPHDPEVNKLSKPLKGWKHFLKALSVVTHFGLQVLNGFFRERQGQYRLHNFFKVHQYGPSFISLRDLTAYHQR